MAWSWDGAALDVQMGFGFAPATAIASITWTTITPYVRSLSFGNGKSDELDTYQSGRLSMSLDNRDRRFDPLHTTGAYYPNLKPMTPMRIRFTYSGTTVTLWTGFVSGFPQSYDPPYDAMVAVTASDGFGVLSRTIMPSLYAAEVTTDTPSLWWRLGEQAGTTAVDASGHSLDGDYIGGATFNTRAGLISDTDNAIAFAAGQAVTRHGVAWPVYPFSVECWFSTTSSGGLVNALAPFAVPFLQVGVSGSGILILMSDAVGNTARASTAATYNDGLTHHVVATWTNGTTVPALYIDGVQDTTGATSLRPSMPDVGTAFVTVTRNDNSNFASFLATIDEVAVYPTALSAARVLVHYNAGTNPYVGLDTGAAVTKILDVIGWPSADRTIETGKTTVVAFDTSGMTALGAIQALEKTEQGRFFIAPDGKATFYNRHHTLTTAASTTSQATFGDSGGELPYGDLDLDYDESKIRNSITTARVDGSPFNVKDTTSITSYRERGYSLTGLLNSSDAELRDMCQWLLTHYKDPATRVPQIVIQPRALPASLFPQVRDRLLGDRVTVKRRPQNVGTAISLAVLIEGIQHDLTLDDWTVKLFLSPAETTGFFRLDDTTYGLLDSNRLAF
jgi:hypothetical protein